MRTRNPGEPDLNPRLEDTKRRVRRDLESILMEVEASPLQKHAKRKTLRDLYEALESVRRIRSLRIPESPREAKEEAKKERPNKTRVKRVERSDA